MGFYQSHGIVSEIGGELVRRTLEVYEPRGLDPNHFAITFLPHERSLSRSGTASPTVTGFGYNASKLFYPCSVVKLFYLVAAQARLNDGFIKAHDELSRAMRDMIIFSSNTATNYIIDLVTGTTGDTLLNSDEKAVWEKKRNWVNRYFRSFGWPEFAEINVCQKLMDDERYGREKVFVGENGLNHNALTTDATARLFYAIFTGQVISPSHSALIADTLSRSLDTTWIDAEPRSQVKGFFGAGLPQGSRLWSKAGRTDWTGDPTASYRRHDAAYVELPNGLAFTLVAFTMGDSISMDETCLPMIAQTTAALLLAA